MGFKLVSFDLLLASMDPEKTEATKEVPTDAESQSVEFTRAEERRLLRKFDFSILPPLTIMWVLYAYFTSAKYLM